jgi:hypothetical protein
MLKKLEVLNAINAELLESNARLHAELAKKGFTGKQQEVCLKLISEILAEKRKTADAALAALG